MGVRPPPPPGYGLGLITNIEPDDAEYHPGGNRKATLVNLTLDFGKVSQPTALLDYTVWKIVSVKFVCPIKVPEKAVKL